MKLINIITAVIILALIALAVINLPAKKYEGPRIYELIELQTDRVILP
jgi:hypothetical protein